MPHFQTPARYLVLVLAAFAANFSAAQDDDWQKKKAERFKPLTAAQTDPIDQAVPQKPTARPQRDRRVLVFYRCEGFIHGSIPYANYALQKMGEQTGAFKVDLADTYDVFTRENLEQYDCIILNNTTGMTFREGSQQIAFLDFINGGKGLMGIHAASDNFGRHPECRAIIGGEFGGHPWNAGGNWAFKLDDPTHVLNAAFEGKGFWHTDEIYQYKKETYVGPQVLRILVSLDMGQEAVSKLINDGPREVPVSWLRTAGDGRVFYTNFGHREDTFQNPMILRHMLDGIQYAIGDLQADATPTAQVPKTAPALSPAKP
jgi:type 1 glutamine amidotransferase